MSTSYINAILVTGGAGFIGANFVNYFSKKYPNIPLIVIDSLTYAGCVKSIEPIMNESGNHFYHGSINDIALVKDTLEQHKINCIVNFAAESHVDRSIESGQKFVETNVLGTYSLLEAAHEYWATHTRFKKQHRFHHVSTDEVYGSLNLNEPAFNEYNQYKPNSPYSASKAASDHFVRSFHHTFGMNVTTTNCSNNFGPFHFPEKLIPVTILNILHNKEIPIYGNGEQIRDWLYVEDHCKAIDLVIHKGISGEVYNIGGKTEISNIELVKKICQLINSIFASKQQKFAERFPNAHFAQLGEAEKLITFVDDRLGHDYRYAIDNTKIESELGMDFQQDFDSKLEYTVNWFLDSKTWWLNKYSWMGKK